MTDFLASQAKPDSVRICSAITPFDWKHASKASICAFMLAFAPLTCALAQSQDDPDYIAPAAPAAADTGDDEIAPAAPAAAAPAVAAPAAAAPAAAVSDAAPSAASSTTTLGAVTVTGTAIARSDAATALPVTTYSAENLRQQGITSTPQLLQQIAGNSSSSGPGLSTGAQVTAGAAFADLRGLGPNKTLILLNGRRLASNSLEGNGAATDLNQIPFAAIDHIEVLRDGASALYGTDAIGGVINFITKKNIDGGGFDVTYTAPTRSGGGDSQTLSAKFGKGDFDKDGWNVLGVLSYQRSSAIDANTRGFVDPLNPNIQAVSSYTFPGNYVAGGDLLNPSAPGCNVPGEVPNTIFDVPGQDPSSGASCLENYTALGAEVQQRFDEPSFYGQGSYKIDDKNSVSLSYLWTRKSTYAIAAPAPTTDGVTIGPSSPFYPGDANAADAGPLELRYRAVPFGQRVTKGVNESHRAVLDFTGQFLSGFHYDTALSYSQSSTDDYLVSGEINQAAVIGTDANGDPIYDPNSLQAAINDGRFNPFTTNPTAAQLGVLSNAETTGDIEAGKTRSYIWDGKVDHEIGDWFGAGQSALALGAQYRHETLDVGIDPFLAPRAPSTGLAANQISQDRDVEGVFGELNVPLFESLELDAQARYDNYSDVGDTVNPKVSLRYQPIQQLTLRASYSEGFHAPTLFDLYEPPSQTFSESGLSDPVLCPNGPGGALAPGGIRARDCSTQFQTQLGGNKDLEPEKSKSWSAGFVLQPISYVSLTADFFAVELSQQIGNPSGQYIFDHADQYQFVRNDNGSIDYYVNPLDNLGKIETNGEDVQLDARLPTDYGNFSLNMQGTYTNKYDFQNVPDGTYFNNVSEFSNQSNNVIFRWKHNVTVGWNKGPMALGVVNHYSSGYQDSFQYSGHHGVHDYVTWDTFGSYAFDSGIQFTVGSNNVFDVDPVYSDQTFAGQAGYDARYASGIGRTVYGRMSYDF